MLKFFQCVFSAILQQIVCNCSLLSISVTPSWQHANSLHLLGLKITILIKAICFKWVFQIPVWCFKSPGQRNERREARGEQQLTWKPIARLENTSLGQNMNPDLTAMSKNGDILLLFIDISASDKFSCLYPGLGFIAFYYFSEYDTIHWEG